MRKSHRTEVERREPRRMRIVDWIMIAGGVIVAVVMTYNAGWQTGALAFVLYMFVFAILRFVAAMFRRRKRKR